MNKKSIEYYLKNVENFYTERIFPTRDYFQTFYLDPNCKIEDEIEYTIEILDYNKKITYLFKHFPYPDIIRIIIKKQKFSQFQEQFLIQNLTRELEINIEENRLITLIQDIPIGPWGAFVEECRKWVLKDCEISICHVPRDDYTVADSLAKIAPQRCCDWIEFTDAPYEVLQSLELDRVRAVLQNGGATLKR